VLKKEQMDNIRTKLKKAWLKLLKAQCKRKWDKARDLHAKIIQIEMEIRRRNV